MTREDENGGRERQARFLSWLSHELRTPLGSVLMLAELLTENAADVRQAGYASKVHQAAAEMRGLLEEVSELARIDGGRVDLVVEELDPNALAARLESELRALARAAGRELQASRGELPATLRCDGRRLLEIARRLTGAVLAAGGSDPVGLRIGRPREEAPAAVFEIGVEPLPAASDERIFEPARGAGKSGLGLPIAGSLARLLGGEVVLRRQAGKATLVLRLPAE